jgi:hypothetical protein
VVVECTGDGRVVVDAIEQLARSGVACLVGSGTGGAALDVVAATWRRR